MNEIRKLYGVVASKERELQMHPFQGGRHIGKIKSYPEGSISLRIRMKVTFMINTVCHKYFLATRGTISMNS